jgi:hypothetical protein
VSFLLDKETAAKLAKPLAEVDKGVARVSVSVSPDHNGEEALFFQHAATRSDQRQRDPEQAPDAIAERSNRDSLALDHHDDATAAISPGGSPVRSNRCDPLDRRLDRVKRLEHDPFVRCQHDAVEYRNDTVASQPLRGDEHHRSARLGDLASTRCQDHSIAQAPATSNRQPAASEG